METLGDGLAVISDGDILLDCRTLVLGGLYLTDDIGIVDADDGLDGGTGVTVHDVVLCQHVSRRDDNGTDLTQGEHHHPPLVAAFQNEHHRVVLANT